MSFLVSLSLDEVMSIHLPDEVLLGPRKFVFGTSIAAFSCVKTTVDVVNMERRN